MAVRVKICGVTRAEDARAAVEAGADLVGLNFYEKSPRYLSLDAASAVRHAVGSRVEVVGVFVNAARDFIAQHVRELHLSFLQFSGDESELDRAGFDAKTIKTIRVGDGPISPDEFKGADFFLIDCADASLYGGTGRRFALDKLGGLDLGRVIIAGGLKPENVAEAAALHPFAVDTASGVESAPGIKDHAKIRSFVTNAKSAG